MQERKLLAGRIRARMLDASRYPQLGQIDVHALPRALNFQSVCDTSGASVIATFGLPEYGAEMRIERFSGLELSRLAPIDPGKASGTRPSLN
jgi:hypothetical protein